MTTHREQRTIRLLPNHPNLQHVLTSWIWNHGRCRIHEHGSSPWATCLAHECVQHQHVECWQKKARPTVESGKVLCMVCLPGHIDASNVSPLSRHSAQIRTFWRMDKHYTQTAAVHAGGLLGTALSWDVWWSPMLQVFATGRRLFLFSYGTVGMSAVEIFANPAVANDAKSPAVANNGCLLQ